LEDSRNLRDAAAVERIDAYLSRCEKDGRFSGYVLMARGGDILFEKGYGLADYETGTPHTKDTVYRIGSITKMMTAAAVLRCRDMGLLRLEDPVSAYIPEYPLGDGITIHHLLSNTSGIPDWSITLWFLRNKYREHEFSSLLGFFKDKPLRFKPGTRFEYSNPNFILAGEIVERVSGMSYPEFLETYFFAPLGMNRSGYDTAASRMGGPELSRAIGYKSLRLKPVRARTDDMTIAGAAGNVYSTPRDMLTWGMALLKGTSISPESMKAMFTAYTLPFGSAGYGYGCYVETRDIAGRRYTVIGHSGGVTGFSTMMSILPEEDVVIIIVSNYRTLLYPYKEEQIEFDISRLLLE